MGQVVVGRGWGGGVRCRRGRPALVCSYTASSAHVTLPRGVMAAAMLRTFQRLTDLALSPANTRQAIVSKIEEF
jgi:hypothetical protein